MTAINSQRRHVVHPKSDKIITHELVLSAQNGDQLAKTEVVKLADGLLRSLAKRYSRYVDFDDAYQAGSIGLLRAIATFKPRGTLRFITFAYNHIVADMILVGKRMRYAVTTPVNHPERVASCDSMSDERSTFLRGAAANDDLLESASASDTAVKVRQILNRCKWLDDVDHAIINRRIQGDDTLESIGRDYGISREAIRQRERKLLTKTLPRILESVRSAVTP